MTSAASARVSVEAVDGHVRLTELSGNTYLQPRPLRVDGPTAQVALVGVYAMLLAGDDLRLDITVGPGVQLELVEPSGTVAYDAHGESARWAATVRVAEGGRLVWRAAPFVVAAGANVERHTQVELGSGARALVQETLVLGRAYEPGGGPLRACLRANYDQRPVLVEDLDLYDTAHRGAPGILGGNRVVATTLLLGTRPEQIHAPHETMLDGPGALARALAVHAHETEGALGGTWDRWRASVTDSAGHAGSPWSTDVSQPTRSAASG
ncbi:MAG TPA: urease accessory protein UreD [Jiangellaceae bacterium]|nr:urease accessory protein UreD [Jiangellaceae bacterium]